MAKTDYFRVSKLLTCTTLSALLFTSHNAWAISPEKQISECETYFHDSIKKSTDDEKRAAIWQVLTNWGYPLSITKENLQITRFYQLRYFEKSIIEKITDELVKRSIYQDIAEVAVLLGDDAQSVLYLSEIQVATEKMTNESQNQVFISLVNEAAKLTDKTQGLAFLTKLQPTIEKIPDNLEKIHIFNALAKAAEALGDKQQELFYLTQAKNIVEKISTQEAVQGIYIDILDKLAKTTAILGDKPQALRYLEQAKAIAEKINIKDEVEKAFIPYALAITSIMLGKPPQDFVPLALMAVEKMYDGKTKIGILKETVELIATLDDKNQGLAYLTQMTKAIFDSDKENEQAFVFGLLAQAMLKLSDDAQTLTYLKQLQAATDKFTYESYKANVFSALAEVTGKFSNKTLGLAYLKELQIAADKLTLNNEKNEKADIFMSLAVAAEKLGDQSQGLAYLAQAKNIAEQYKETNKASWQTANLFENLAEASTILGDKTQGLQYLQATVDTFSVTEEVEFKIFNKIVERSEALGKKQGLAYLKQAKTMVADRITNPKARVYAFRILAEESAELGDKKQALSYLMQSGTAAEKIEEEGGKDEAFTALAEVAGKMGYLKQALQFSKQAINAYSKAKTNYSRAFLINARLHAQAGHYQTACNLIHNENVNKEDVLKIIAIVLSEYTKTHDLQ
jgi:hypothetical protein